MAMMPDSFRYPSEDPTQTAVVDSMVVADIPPIEFAAFNTGRLPAQWGDYDEVQFVAEGGMGHVYKAWHRHLKRYEALKLMRGDQFPRETDVYRFRFEAEAAATLNHANIVPVYGGGEVNGLPYFCMKWISGGNLNDELDRYRNDPIAIAKLMAKLARAIHHAHLQGILHRDLKPLNILIDESGEPQISDFGLAKRTDSDLGMTATGAVLGTPQFMSPEQARGSNSLTTAVDIYGLGGILYVLLTGQAAFQGSSIPEVIKKIATDPPPSPRLIVPTANCDLEAICLKCLEKDPRDRYPTALALAEDLELFADGKPVSVRPPALWEWAVREFTKTPPLFNGYVWQVKVSFAIIIALSQLAVFGLVLANTPAFTVWIAFILSWMGGAFALWWQMAAKFTRLPATEQHSVMIAIGHIFAHMALAMALMPWVGVASDCLRIYPAMFAVSALALFVVGTTHWGQFYLLSLFVAILAPFSTLVPVAAPLLFGGSLAAIMLYWAWAVKVRFGVTDSLGSNRDLLAK